jgi:hypothetical protein
LLRRMIRSARKNPAIIQSIACIAVAFIVFISFFRLARSLAKKPASEFLPGDLLRRTPVNLFNAARSRVPPG